VPDLKLRVRTGLEHIAVPGRLGAPDGDSGVALAVRAGVAVASVMSRKGRHEHLSQRMFESYGLSLPTQGRRNSAEAVALVWAGPGRWLAISDKVAADLFERQLHECTAGIASVCDQSDSQVLMRVAGSRARDVLAKELIIDLHPRSFGPGDVAMTGFGRIPVQFWQLDPLPSYEFAVPRCLAVDFWRAVVLAGSEFGLAIER